MLRDFEIKKIIKDKKTYTSYYFNYTEKKERDGTEINIE